MYYFYIDNIPLFAFLSSLGWKNLDREINEDLCVIIAITEKETGKKYINRVKQ